MVAREGNYTTRISRLMIRYIILSSPYLVIINSARSRYEC